MLWQSGQTGVGVPSGVQWRESLNMPSGGQGILPPDSQSLSSSHWTRPAQSACKLAEVSCPEALWLLCSKYTY